MGRPKGPPTRVGTVEDRGGTGTRRYRLRAVVDGQPVTESFATERAAEAFRQRLLAAAATQATRTQRVEDAIEDWLKHRAEEARKPVHRYHERWPRHILASVLDSEIGDIASSDLEALWKKTTRDLAGDTANLALKCLGYFVAWARKHRGMAWSLEDVERRTDTKKGKPQIETQREMLAFDAVLWKDAEAGDVCALGILLGLYMGLGVGEVRSLHGRHVDVNNVLVVPGTKTENRHRNLPVASPELWALLERRVVEVGLAAPLVRKNPNQLNDALRDAARRAGAANHAVLSFHSLRGMAASLSTRDGAPFEAIARALGHSSYAVTGAHYATRASQDEAKQKARLSVLKGGK